MNQSMNPVLSGNFLLTGQRGGEPNSQDPSVCLRRKGEITHEVLGRGKAPIELCPATQSRSTTLSAHWR